MAEGDTVSDVTLRIEEGPVQVQANAGTGVDAKYVLEDNLEAHEYYPGGVDSAHYVLTLRAESANAGDVKRQESRLIGALSRLCAVWPFSGGSFLSCEKHLRERIARYVTNAAEVQDQHLALSGKRSVVSRLSMAVELCATYRQFPLEEAVRLDHCCTADPCLAKLCGYYYLARAFDSEWYIHLYKLLDILKERYRGHKKAVSALGLDQDDWSWMERALNDNDLRHGSVKEVHKSKVADRSRAFDHGYNFIVTYMKTVGHK